MNIPTLMNKAELATALRTTPETIANQIYLGNEGSSIPPSIKLGGKRLWNSESVLRWLEEKEAQTPAPMGAVNSKPNSSKPLFSSGLSSEFMLEAKRKVEASKKSYKTKT